MFVKPLFGTVTNTQLNQLHKERLNMATHYKNQRITELLDIIGQMEKKLNIVRNTMPEGWNENNQDLAHAYTTITIAKAKLTALQGEGK